MEVDAQETRMSEAVAERTKSDDSKFGSIWTAPDKVDLVDDDPRTTQSVQITHPDEKRGCSNT